MRNTVLLGLLLYSFSLLQGQEFIHEFGKYSGEEFTLKSFEKYKSSEAVVIYDIGKSYFVNTDNGFKLYFERQTKIKILSKAGIENANVEIPYYVDNEFEDVEEVEGNTYNFENGELQISKLNKKNIYDEKVNSRWMVKKFVMPNVTEGSIVEFKYRIISPYVFNFRNWDFQTRIPVIYSEYLTKMIPFYTYNYLLQGASKFDIMENHQDTGSDKYYGPINYHDVVYKFVMKDLPAFKDEAFISSPEDYKVKINFQLSAIVNQQGTERQIMSTWPKLVSDLLDDEDFGKYLKSSAKTSKPIFDSWGLNFSTETEKAEYILKYIKANYTWNREIDKMAHRSVKELIKQKTGNSAEINLYLIGMLRSAGLDANPVIISTRKHGKIATDYPFLHFFNDVLAGVKIDGKFKLLDGTDPLCTFEEIPTNCVNDKGLIVNKVKDIETQWVKFNYAKYSEYSQDAELWFNDKKDSLIGNFTVNSTGYEALNLRKLSLIKKEDLEKEVMNTNLKLTDSIITVNDIDLSKPYIVKFKASMAIDKIDSMILISPFCGNAISKNPLVQATRTFDIDMIYKQSKRFKTIIHLPDGYKLKTHKDNVIINNDIVDIKCITDFTDNVVTILGSYTFLKSVYSSDNYAQLKAFYNIIIKNFNDQIVLINAK